MNRSDQTRCSDCTRWKSPGQFLSLRLFWESWRLIMSGLELWKSSAWWSWHHCRVGRSHDRYLCRIPGSLKFSDCLTQWEFLCAGEHRCRISAWRNKKGQVTLIGRGAIRSLILWNYPFITFPFSLHSPFSIKKKCTTSESVHGALQGCYPHLAWILFPHSHFSWLSPLQLTIVLGLRVCGIDSLRDVEHGSQQEILQIHACPHWSTMSPSLTTCMWKRKLQE